MLRIYQGKEIDFIKTGKRWVITKSLRKNLQKLPYFVLHNYPKKMKVYDNRKAKNRELKDSGVKLQYNAFHSPTQMQELCDYIETWEMKKVKWSKIKNETYPLLVNSDIEFSRTNPIFRICREINENFTKEWINVVRNDDMEVRSTEITKLFDKYKEVINKNEDEVGDVDLFSNYFIHACNYRTQLNKHLCWEVYGDIMLANVRKNTTDQKEIKIVECDKSDINAQEFLGKWYKIEEITEEVNGA